MGFNLNLKHSVERHIINNKKVTFKAVLSMHFFS